MIPSLENLEDYEPPLKKLRGGWSLVVLENGTCCYRAGEHFAKWAFEDSPSFVQAPSFKEALNFARAQKHILLLPHVHRIIGDVETDYSWESMGEYIFRLENTAIFSP